MPAICSTRALIWSLTKAGAETGHRAWTTTWDDVPADRVAPKAWLSRMSRPPGWVGRPGPALW